jgi:hypothetical protein
MYVDEAAAVAEFKIRMTTKSLVLKRGSISRSSGQWRDDDYDVLEDGVVVHGADCAAGSPLDVGERPQRRHQARRTRLRADA